MLEKLIHICKCQSFILNVPIKIYSNNSLIESFDPHSYILNVDLVSPHLEQLKNTNESINYFITSQLFIMGIIKKLPYESISDNQDSYYVVVGPSYNGNISEQTTKELITSGLYPLELNQCKQLHNYLKKIASLDIVKFSNLLSILNTIINRTTIDPKQILASGADHDISLEVEHSMLKMDEETSFGVVARRNPYDKEAEMLFCIKYGLTNRLLKLPLSSDIQETGILGFDNTRHTKNGAIILNSLSLRAAIAGGLNQETAYQLGEIYLHKIEACKNQRELSAVCQSIQVDYCERVRKLQYPDFNDPLINKAIHYINENIHKKITASEIADMLSVSKEYLSKRFKKATNTTIPDYINRQKITESKRLLRFTNKSLSDISEYLSYSSQSYFQNMFKKYEGTTPLEYRKSLE